MINLLKSMVGLKVNNEPKLNMVSKGKAMPYNVKVKVPGGWLALKELREGSKVIGPMGNIASVTEVIPQGVTDCYKFIFEDGREAVSHPLHLWEVYEGNSVAPYVTTTADIIAHFNEFEYAIPLVGEISGAEKRIADEFVKDIAMMLIGERHTVNREIQELHYQDRRAIATAMRTNEGCVASNGTVRYITEHKQSALNFQHLAWSVGGIADLQKVEDGYVVTARHRDIEQDDIARFAASRLKIVGIVKEHPTETICINIDSEDKLFVVEDWIVTHNLCIN
jgi:hypothetical protein